MLEHLDLDNLRKFPQVAYYFRYKLHQSDFHDLRWEDRSLGDYAAKPLYDSLTPTGQVDRSSGYNGDIASLFVPAAAGSVHDVRLLLTHIAPLDILLPSGRRNWLAIRSAARDSILQMLKVIPDAGEYRVIPLTD